MSLYVRWGRFKNWLSLTPPGMLASRLGIVLGIVALIIALLVSHADTNTSAKAVKASNRSVASLQIEVETLRDEVHADRRQIGDLQSQLTCRSDIATDVTTAQADLAADTSLALYALARKQPNTFNVYAERGRAAAAALAKAKQQRQQASQRC